MPAGSALVWRLAGQLLPQWALLAVAASAPLWLPGIVTVREQAFSGTAASLVLLLFLGLLPWWNAICDYVSVGLTRVILDSYRERMAAGTVPSQRRWLTWLLVDLLLALLLTAVLLLGTFVCLAGLRRLGWGVDARATLATFEASAWWSSGSFWLISMAFTNVLPTLMHMGLVLTAVVSQRWSRHHQQLPRWLTTLESGSKLTELQGDAVLMYLWGWRAIWLCFTVLLLAAMFAVVGWVMSQVLPLMSRPLVEAVLTL